ncbi:glycosyltransferase family A protein [Arthrobacter tecti]
MKNDSLNSTYKRGVGFGSNMLSDDELRLGEIEALRTDIFRSETREALGSLRGCEQHGISVIVAAYRSRLKISRCMESLLHQDLNAEFYEIIVVLNGPDDGTLHLIDSIRGLNSGHSIRIVQQVESGAGAARNAGLSVARFSYVTFVDDDDWVGTSFLSSLLACARPDTVAIAPIINVSSEGEEDAESSLNLQISSRYGERFKFAEAPGLLGFNACKLIPTAIARAHRYAEHLRSGEDVCYMARVASAHMLNAVVGTLSAGGSYYRVLTQGSISRRKHDFDFAVLQRLEVIAELEKYRSWKNTEADTSIASLIRSQANFVRNYLSDSPEDRSMVVKAIDEAGVRDFPWRIVNAGMARDLVVSYCFAPYSDTSAVVASKAVVERGKVVDVIYNRMDDARKRDSNLELIANKYIASATEIESQASFAGWSRISDFVRRGIAVAERKNAQAGGYESVYSRVLWAGSHYLAALYKLRHPAVNWVAEFSDPLSTDAEGSRRPGDLGRDALFEVYQQAVISAGYKILSTNSLFSWCEYLTYIFADEIIFTNTSQLDYMVSQIEDLGLRQKVGEKARVRPHPVPPAWSYDAIQSSYPLSQEYFNIGYFGAFYNNRGLTDVLEGLVGLPVNLRKSVRLHVFTNRPEEFRAEILETGLVGVVVANSYVPYLEFLNLTKRFNLLAVNDVMRSSRMATNPFLPSKYSDYLGSGTEIWGIVDEGSPLDRAELSYRSAVGDASEASSTMMKALADWNMHF